MDDAILRQRLDAARVGHLATTRPDGRPHVVPCCFALAGDTVYSAVDAKPKSTLALQRLRNLAVHPAASLVVDHYDEDWAQLWWIRLDGAARVVDSGAERDSGIAALTAKYAQYVEAPPPGSVIAFDVDAWRGWP